MMNGNGIIHINRNAGSPTRHPSRNNKSNIIIFLAYPFVAAILSGIVCYHLGKLSTASSWDKDKIDNADDIQQKEDASPYHLRSDNGILGIHNSGKQESQHKHNATTSYAAASDPKNDRRLVPRDNMNCGVVFFYHIPSTGGNSINKWFQKYKEPPYNISYYQWWAVETNKDGSFHTNPEKGEATFNEGMANHIQNLGPTEWRVAHSHLISTYLNESAHILNQWRTTIESQGCELINAVMLRDPLSHALSLHKSIKTKSATREEWTAYLASPTGPGKWATILDFFLYNNHGLRYHDDYPNGPGGRNPFNVTKEIKVSRAMELLHRHFDIVTVGDHDTFMDAILKWTGWKRIKYKRKNTYGGTLSFTKKEVENLQKLLRKNGDIEFIDRVKEEYHGYLSYI